MRIFSIVLGNAGCKHKDLKVRPKVWDVTMRLFVLVDCVASPSGAHQREAGREHSRALGNNPY